MSLLTLLKPQGAAPIVTKVWIKVGPDWRLATPYIKVNTVWRQATPKINVSGAWK